MIQTFLIRILFEEKTNMQVKINTITLITSSFCRHHKYKLKLNWRAIHQFLDRNLFKPSLNHSFAKGGFDDSSWGKFVYLVNILKEFYPEETFNQVLKNLYQNYSPFFVNISKGACLLYIFFKTS